MEPGRERYQVLPTLGPKITVQVWDGENVVYQKTINIKYVELFLRNVMQVNGILRLPPKTV